MKVSIVVRIGNLGWGGTARFKHGYTISNCETIIYRALRLDFLRPELTIRYSGRMTWTIRDGKRYVGKALALHF